VKLACPKISNWRTILSEETASHLNRQIKYILLK